MCGPRGAPRLVLAVCLLHIALQVCGEDAKLGSSEVSGVTSLKGISWVETMPIEVVYFLQAHQLSQQPGDVLAALALRFRDDVAVVGKCALAARTWHQREAFLRELHGAVLLKERVQRELAACMVHWFPDTEKDWQYKLFNFTTEIGNPMLAAVPREFLYSLSNNQQFKFLYHLRQWDAASPTERLKVWARKPRGVLRSWAETLATAKYPTDLNHYESKDVQMHGFILLGASPDELRVIPRSALKFTLNMPLAPLQARVAFRASFPQGLEVPAELTSPVMGLLTPSQLRRIDMSKINSSDMGLKPLSSRYQPSWASARQMTYLLMEHAQSRTEVASARDSASWGLKGLKHVARWVHALPLTTLERMMDGAPDMLDDPLRGKGHEVVTALDESPLSPRQVRVLMSGQLGSMESCNTSEASSTVAGAARSLRGRLLLALPADCVKNASVSMLPQDTLVKLVTNLPTESTAIFPLYTKLYHILGHDWLLNAVMENANPGAFLRLLSSADMLGITPQLHETFLRHPEVPPLPRSVLSRLLGYWRVTSEALSLDWRAELLLTPALLPGLRCEDLTLLGPEAALPVLSTLGQYLQDKGQPFPRDLQNCALESLLEFLARRSANNYVSGVTVRLLDTMEPAEIEAVGGYILAGLPLAAVAGSTRWPHVVHAVGRLSVLELLELQQHGAPLSQLADLAREHENPHKAGLATFELLGNLLQVAPRPAELAAVMEPRAFRLWLEGLERDEDTALCVSAAARTDFWASMAVKAYGEPREWSAATLGALRGVLAAMSSTQLKEIPLASWAEAADVINLGNGYTSRFIQMCSEILGPEEAPQFERTTYRLQRHLLDASRLLANLVHPPKSPTPSSTLSREEARVQLTGVHPARSNLTVIHARTRRSVAGLPDSRIEDDTKTSQLEPIHQINLNKQLRCGALRMASSAASLVLEERDLQNMEDSELEECLELLGTLRLSADTTAAVWQAIQQRGLQAEVRDLGWLLSHANMSLLSEAPLNELDTLTVIGRHMSNWTQVRELAMLVIEAHNLTGQELPMYLAGAMGTLVCGLAEMEYHNFTTVLRPDVLVRILPLVANTLASTESCPPHLCLRNLISHATHSLALGPINTWRVEDLTSLNLLAAGLTAEQLRELRTGVSAGITAEAERCMPQDVRKALSPSQLRELPLSVMDELLRVETELEEEQRDVLHSVLVPERVAALLQRELSSSLAVRPYLHVVVSVLVILLARVL